MDNTFQNQVALITGAGAGKKLKKSPSFYLMMSCYTLLGNTGCSLFTWKLIEQKLKCLFKSRLWKKNWKVQPRIFPDSTPTSAPFCQFWQHYIQSIFQYISRQYPPLTTYSFLYKQYYLSLIFTRDWQSHCTKIGKGGSRSNRYWHQRRVIKIFGRHQR